jgi:hypothetical protein
VFKRCGGGALHVEPSTLSTILRGFVRKWSWSEEVVVFLTF